MSNAKARSPYQRKQKKPFQYSEQYRSWRAAVMSGGLAAKRASDIHKEKFLGTQAAQGAQQQ